MEGFFLLISLHYWLRTDNESFVSYSIYLNLSVTGVSDCSLEWGEGLEIFQKVDIFVQSLGLLKLAIEVSNDYLSEIRSANIFIISLHQCFVAAFHHHHLYCGIPNFCSTWMTYEITNDISDGFFCQGRSQYCSFYTYFSC